MLEPQKTAPANVTDQTSEDGGKRSCTATQESHTNVQERPNAALLAALPKAAVLLEVVKPLEQRLRMRGLLRSNDSATFHPLWFLAETERNVFLWRRGCSLGQQDQFEFWVDLRLLISKRLHQLENVDFENPFLNPGWGSSLPSGGVRASEQEY